MVGGDPRLLQRCTGVGPGEDSALLVLLTQYLLGVWKFTPLSQGQGWVQGPVGVGAAALTGRGLIFLFLQLQPEQLDCGAAHLQHPLSILQPLRSTPVFRAPGLTSVAVASANNYTVVFLGTVNGRLLKVGVRGRAGMAGEVGPFVTAPSMV